MDSRMELSLGMNLREVRTCYCSYQTGLRGEWVYAIIGYLRSGENGKLRKGVRCAQSWVNREGLGDIELV